ncbi:hypothetical protein SISNIDRAFT_405001 [Sistotremastrum niveocremeum HHB9708]|uniref:18S rRNA factor 2 n=1 Tax=Sistotremastrum niveocremeum HHB9708 TaxID=1314777 RepID=A0A164ZUQ9_9AGAM|nr:hypothetical protein SISNIDRAFT_405001 [Sistotremastrum niveocremeum HHB9708]
MSSRNSPEPNPVENDAPSNASEQEEELAGSDEDEQQEPVAGPSNPEKSKVLTKEALTDFQAAQEKAGIIYISRIPPGMQPAKVRHLMSAYGEIGRVFLQQEDPKRAHLRRKHTTTKKAHYTEGWVEFKNKKIARRVAEMLNAQPIGGKKGSRWRDDVWSMKYLPRFKWYMLTEQVAHESAMHTAKLRVELNQSRAEQHDYLRQVELARVLEKREKKKKEKEGDDATITKSVSPPAKRKERPDNGTTPKRRKLDAEDGSGLDRVLESVF